ncbi:hybrid nucleoside-diphosphate sugar epimerase/sugar transferase [Sphingomonas sp. 22R3R2A-7]|uniref:hybrid nucleoside-diphosphate sugar epimerase/sugar transferase n=1 Tax=Sphingomonas sp. 22R3R2A-7 TaxID=3050230 RepID=UPI002FE3E22A
MIVLTGATGFVGSQLVRQLGAQAELLLVSRDPEAARRRFAEAAVCDYATLSGHDLTGAVIIHLAARNNDRVGTIEEFRAGNVDGLLEVAAIAKAGGAARFINLCSTHALDTEHTDPYGLSKREGARALTALWPDGAINLYVPAIYGNDFRGRLAVLNRLPAVLKPLAIGLLRQVKPMISINRLLAVLLELAAEPDLSDDPWKSERYAADPVKDIGISSVVKRTVDLLAVLAVVVLLGWLMIIVALYIRFDSKGPAIFAQQRVGRDGRIFTCYKFRTMTLGTAHAATHDVSAASVTVAGRFLRRTKIDELPQVVNVLMNDMSLVGPRPCLPMQTELIARRRARGILRLKPGITGLAQINEIDMSDPARLAAWDDRYGAFQTLSGYIVILIRTVLGGGSGDRVSSY